MGIRFRKSINLGGGARINLSKSGIGYSLGTKGARITKTAKGRIKTTVGIPNTGISHTSESHAKKKNTNQNKKSNTNQTNKVSSEKVGNNMFSKFNLTDKELELFTFIWSNQESLDNEFDIHDISCKGYIATSTYYNNLYDKGLLVKPSRGKYSLNKELLSKLAEDWQKKQKEEASRKVEQEKKKRRDIKIILGILLMFIFPPYGLLYFIIGFIEFKNKQKNNI